MPKGLSHSILLFPLNPKSYFIDNVFVFQNSSVMGIIACLIDYAI